MQRVRGFVRQPIAGTWEEVPVPRKMKEDILGSIPFSLLPVGVEREGRVVPFIFFLLLGLLVAAGPACSRFVLVNWLVRCGPANTGLVLWGWPLLGMGGRNIDSFVVAAVLADDACAVLAGPLNDDVEVAATAAAALRALVLRRRCSWISHTCPTRRKRAFS